MSVNPDDEHLLTAGASMDEILRDYEMLERSDIRAAIVYAARHPDDF